MNVESHEPELMTPRNPWVAGLLALFCGFVGLVYVGRLRRGVVWLLAIWAIALIGIAAMLYFAAGPLSMTLALIAMIVPHFALVVDTVRLARQPPNRPRRPYQRLWVYLLLVIGVTLEGAFVTSLIRRYWTEAYVLPVQSMADTMLSGDRFMVDKLALRFRPLHRGDVIVYVSQDPGAPIYCKRLIGLPGEVVEVRKEQVLINGQPIDEPYAKFAGDLPTNMPNLIDYGPITVPDDEVFLLGDNRRSSRDSRTDGPYPRKAVFGIVRVIFWSREYSWTPPHGLDHNPEDDFVWGVLRPSRIGLRVDGSN